MQLNFRINISLLDLFGCGSVAEKKRAIAASHRMGSKLNCGNLILTFSFVSCNGICLSYRHCCVRWIFRRCRLARDWKIYWRCQCVWSALCRDPCSEPWPPLCTNYASIRWVFCPTSLSIGSVALCEWKKETYRKLRMNCGAYSSGFNFGAEIEFQIGRRAPN